MSQFEGHGTGALPLPPDWRDYEIACIPGVNQMLKAGAPAEHDLRHLFKGIYNQGAEPSCVCFSTCGMLSAFEQAEKGRWLTFDGHGLYRQLGGTGSGGVPTRDTLQYCQDPGAWLLNAPNTRFKIKNYAFVGMRMQHDVEVVKAAVASGRPCVLAMLLPTDFSASSSGANVSGVQSYHQVVIAGYNQERLFGPNSWGDNWGGGGPLALPQGWYSVPWQFLFHPQNAGYVYVYTVEDAADDGDVTPPPPKPTKATIGAKLTGPGVDQLAVGQTLAVSGGGFTGSMVLNQIAIDNNTDPPPDTLTVTGYSKNPVKPGESFVINGGGFSGGILTVTWGGVVLSASRLSSTTISAAAPANTGQNPVQVRVEGSTAEGPILTVSTGDTPPPVGDVEVTLFDQRRIGSTIYVKARATLGGQPVHTIMTAYVDDSPVVNGGRDVPAGGFGYWGARVKTNPAVFRVDATADDGKTGSASVSV